jgi:hypothetical protein
MKAGAEKAVTFDRVNGATIGNGATTTLQVICSNATTKSETALTFISQTVLKSSTYLKNFVLFPRVDDFELSNVRVTTNTVGLNTTDALNIYNKVIV